MDISTKYNEYANIGYEFLTYLYYNANTNTDINYELGKKIVFAKFIDDKIYEKTVISGEGSDTLSGNLLLSEGALVIEMQLLFNLDSQVPIYIKAKDFNFSGIKMPKLEEADDNDFLLRLDYIERVLNYFNYIFDEFIKLRISNEWEDKRLEIVEYVNQNNR